MEVRSRLLLLEVVSAPAVSWGNGDGSGLTEPLPWEIDGFRQLDPFVGRQRAHQPDASQRHLAGEPLGADDRRHEDVSLASKETSVTAIGRSLSGSGRSPGCVPSRWPSEAWYSTPLPAIQDARCRHHSGLGPSTLRGQRRWEPRQPVAARLAAAGIECEFQVSCAYHTELRRDEETPALMGCVGATDHYCANKGVANFLARQRK